MKYNFNGLRVSNRLIASTAFEYGRGHSFFENPWMWIWIKTGLSGISYFGAFITPTITVNEKIGNLKKSRPWTIIKIYPDKILNKKGWRNCGIDKFVNQKLPVLKRGEQKKTIVSIGALDSYLEIPLMLGRLNASKIAAVEINVSCHNVDLCFLSDFKVLQALFREARKASQHPLGIKLNFESDYITIAKIAQDEGINFLHAINTTIAYSESLGHCGMSSYKNKPKALKVISDLRRSGITIPIIGGSGIWKKRDFQDFENSGADLFSVSHQFLYFPPWLSILAKRVG